MNCTYSKDIEKSCNHVVWNSRTVLTLLICLAVPLLVGGLSSFITRNAMMTFNLMNKPPLAPPAWLFPIAWTILYIMMGLASFLIYKSTDESSYIGMTIYIIQLILNFVWSLIFFRLNAYVFAAVWLAFLLIMIVSLIINTAKYSKAAMLMLIPYGLWCCFAMYLNVGIAMLN